MKQAIPQIYTLQEINKATSSSTFASDLVASIRDGFVAYSKGSFNACPIQTMGAPPMAPFYTGSESSAKDMEYSAQTCVKSGYLSGESHYVIKVASGGYPLPGNSGLMQVFSQKTGRLEALLLDEGILTELRTAAVGAVVANYLAPKNITCIGMLGSGIQARYQLQYIKLTTNCRKILVWGRTSSNVDKFIQDMEKDGWTVTATLDPNNLLKSCELIITTTSSRESILGVDFDKSLLHPNGQHITCIGADSTGKIELDPRLVENANLLVADSRLQTEERGEFEAAIKSELINLNDVVELGELVGKVDLHRKQEDTRLTIFDSSGVAVQDCVVAKMVYETLLTQSETP